MFSNQLEPKRTAEIRERMLRKDCRYAVSFAISVSRWPWNASRRRRLQAHLQIA